MADQRTDAAERSAHVTRGTDAHAEALCCVCRASWRLCSYAARVGPPLMQVCSAECAGRAPFARGDRG